MPGATVIYCNDIRIEGSIPALINLNITTNSSGDVPGYVQNVTFRNVILQKAQSTLNGPSRSRLYGAVLNGRPAYVSDFLFEHVQIEGESLSITNAPANLDIDPGTTTNIQFRAGG